MDETSNYQSIEDGAANAHTSSSSNIFLSTRAIISKARLKQLIFSAVVIIFVSVSAVTLSNTSHSTKASTSGPLDNPIQSVTRLTPVTRSPSPAAQPTAGVTTPSSPASPSNETPQMTPVSTPSPQVPPSSSTSPPGDSSQTFPGNIDTTTNDGDDNSSSSSEGSKNSSPAFPNASTDPTGDQITPSGGFSSGSSSSSSSLSASRPQSSGSSSSSQPQGSSSSATSSPSSTPRPGNSSSTTPVPSSSTTPAPSSSSSTSTTTSSTSSSSSSSPFSSSSSSSSSSPSSSRSPTSSSTATAPSSSSPQSFGTGYNIPALSPSSAFNPTSPSPATSSSSVTQSATGALTGGLGVALPTPAPSSGKMVAIEKPIIASSLPTPAPTSTKPVVSSHVTPKQITTVSSMPKSTPQQTTTTTTPRPQRSPQKAIPAADRTPTPTPTPAVSKIQPRPSSLPKAAIQYGSEVQTSNAGVLDNNPTEYPQMDCLLPNYISKNGKMFAVGPAGETEPIMLKGVNWFGMETETKMPLGLWSNDKNGTTLFEIASFLARNKFNSVRLPISIESVLNNSAPNATTLMNQVENFAVNLKTYMTTLQSVITGLAQHQISVLISLHTLTPSDAGLLRESEKISEDSYLSAIDVLTGSLCSKEYWNVLGLNLKNEPAQSTWGDDSESDFRAAATRMGDRMLNGCSKWLAFVEGGSEHQGWTSPLTGKHYEFDEWQGSGLSKAKEFPVKLSVPNKVVYAPHYYTPAVYPSSYFYGTEDNGTTTTELSDKELHANIKGTFELMFGYLAKEPESPALVMGEFGGLYTTDRHPEKTIQRAFDYTVKLIAETSGFAGGYVWSLNPESSYEYNFGEASSIASEFHEGLVQNDWRTANVPFLDALKPLDAIASLSKLQCFKKKFRLRR